MRLTGSMIFQICSEKVGCHFHRQQNVTQHLDQDTSALKVSFYLGEAILPYIIVCATVTVLLTIYFVHLGDIYLSQLFNNV